MLNEIYRYGQENGVFSPPGFKQKRVKYYVSLSLDGAFLGILNGGDAAISAPDLGSLTQGDLCNILLEKCSIVFCLPEKDGAMKATTQKKHVFFLESLESGATAEPKFAVAAAAIQNDAVKEEILVALDAHKVKPGDVIGFCVDGLRLESSKNYLSWWETFRKEQLNRAPGKAKEASEVRCLITGELTEPLSTTGKINGLQRVGGHASGDALIGFDKDAFCSYGFSQGENAPVSDEAMAAIRGTLEQLIQEAPVLAGSRFIHWYKEPVKIDPISILTLDSMYPDDAPEAEVEEPESDTAADRAADRRTATKLVESILSGEHPKLPENRYYILSLTGAGGRIMVRSWMQGRYEELYDHIAAWYADLKLNSSFGDWLPKRLTQYYYRLLKPGNSKKSFSDRMAEELSSLNQQILFAIINGTPLPDAMAAKALYYIRSNMQNRPDAAENAPSRAPAPDQTACSLLKAWLIRKRNLEHGSEGCQMTSELNETYEGVAYHIGRMMAVYAKLQLDAYGNVNVGVVERYYAGACTKPALVLGRLAQLSGYYLSKMEPARAAGYKKLLSEISLHIDPALPKQFTLAQQAEFAIGYYQENAFLYKKKSGSEAEQND